MKWKDRAGINSFIIIFFLMVILVIFLSISIITLSYCYKKGAIILTIAITGFIMFFILFLSIMKISSIYDKLMIKIYNKEIRKRKSY